MYDTPICIFDGSKVNMTTPFHILVKWRFGRISSVLGISNRRISILRPFRRRRDYAHIPSGWISKTDYRAG